MILRVHPIETTAEWWAFGDYHPRKMIVTDCGDCECIEGLMVDDGTKPEGAARKETRPFRFYIPYGRSYEQAGLNVRRLVENEQNLMERTI